MKHVVTRMPTRVKVAAAIGFLAPIFWGILAFIFFNAAESFLTTLFWYLVYVTCPFWFLPGRLGMWLMPFLNAALYVLIAAGTLRFRRTPSDRGEGLVQG